MTKINSPKFSSPSLQKAVDEARTFIEGASNAMTMVSNDIKELEAYLRSAGLKSEHRFSHGRSFIPDEGSAASLEMSGNAGGVFEDEALAWMADASGAHRLMHVQSVWEGYIDVDAPGGPYFCNEDSITKKSKPLIEAPFEVRKRLYETHVVDFVSSLAKHLRVDQPKSRSERIDEAVTEAVGNTTASKPNGKPAMKSPRSSGHAAMRDIHLSSRYDKQSELSEMAAIVNALPPEIACHLESVFCDSKACAWYSVKLKDGAAFERTASALQKAFIAAGGFNGLQVVAANGATRDFDPWWPEGDDIEDIPE